MRKSYYTSVLTTTVILFNLKSFLLQPQFPSESITDSPKPDPFPSQYSLYAEHSCELLEPLSGVLRASAPECANGWLRFRIRVPDAIRVAVIIEHEWDEMSRVPSSSAGDGSGGSADEWMVNVFMRDYFGEHRGLRVSAVFPESQNSREYLALLQYLVI